MLRRSAANDSGDQQHKATGETNMTKQQTNTDTTNTSNITSRHKEIIRTALLTPTSRGWGAPLLCEAEPGTAKTSRFKQAATEYGLPCEVLSPGERGEGAFGVICVPTEDKDGRWLEALPPGWAKKFNGREDARGLLVVDEVTSAPAALQPPLLGLINDGRIGEYHFAPGIRIIGLCNPAELAAYGQSISAANANRFVHVPWAAPTVEEHALYMLGVGMHGMDVEKAWDIAAEEEKVKAAWNKWAWAEAVGLETGFLKARADLKNVCPKAGDPAASKAWPSDRTWELATRCYATACILGISQPSREELIAGCVGQAAANDWFTYIEEADLPDVAAMLDGQDVGWEHNHLRVDRTAAVLSSVAALVGPATAEKRRSRIEGAWDLIQRLTERDDFDKDLAVPCMARIATAKPIVLSGSARKVLASMESVLNAAGLSLGGS